MNIYFVINHANIATIEEATVAEAVQMQNWFDSGRERPRHFFLTCPAPDFLEGLIQENGIENVVPVGSMEFVALFCEEHNVPVPTAINIPPELDDYRYLQRRIWRGLSKEDVLALPSLGQQDTDQPVRYLIKPGKTIKRFEITAFCPGKGSLDTLHLPDDEPLFLSEYLTPRIISEWRLFVRHGLIQDLRPYYLKDWVMPDLELCKEMVERVKGYPAITLDVAVLETGKTVAIEVHTFLACGFYGLEGPDILTLMKLAWKDQCYHRK